MKKYYFTLIPFVLLFSCGRQCDQNVVSETYVHKYGLELPAEDWSDRGEHGLVIRTLANGVKVCEVYNAGVLDGDCTYTYPHSEIIERVESYSMGGLFKVVQNSSSGAPAKEIRYLSPTERTVTVWYGNGTPQSIEKYNDINLISGEYYTTANQIESTVENGEGIRVIRDAYGQLVSRDTISGGDMVMSTTFYPNGTIYAVTPYVRGIVQGQKRTFLPSGEPITVEEWKNNQQSGLTEVFVNGERVGTVPYVSGMKEGIERRYRNGNQVVEEISWHRDQRYGPSTTYVEGNVKTDWYIKDTQVSKPTYDQHIKSQRL